jgi:hypothetical protein
MLSGQAARPVVAILGRRVYGLVPAWFRLVPTQAAHAAVSHGSEGLEKEANTENDVSPARCLSS